MARGKSNSVSLRAFVEGRDTFQRDIKAMKAEIKEFKSELNLLEKQYKGQEASLEALSKKYELQEKTLKNINSIIDVYKDRNRLLSDAIKEQNGNIEAWQKELEQAKVDLDKAGVAVETNAAKVKEASDKYEKFNGYIADAKDRIAKAKKELADGTITQEEYNKKVKDAETAIKRFTTQQNNAKTELDKQVKALNDAKTEQQGYADAIKKAEGNIKGCEERIKDFTRQISENNTQINNFTGQAIDLDNALKETEGYLDEAKQSADGTSESLKKLTDEEGKNEDAARKLAEEYAKQKLVEAFDLLKKGILDSLEASKKFETSLTDVAKTSNMSGEELRAFGEQIKELSTTIPATADSLNKIASLGAQMGVANDKLIEFTEIIANLGVATDLTASEAATMLAQFASVTGMDVNQYSNMASAIVELGNNYATTEKSIALFAQRVAGAATSANIGQADIIGMSTAVLSLGIQADAGSTAMQSLIAKIDTAVATGKNLDKWAEISGLSADEFAAKWGTDATEAIELFFSGLANTDKNLTSLLSTLGISEQRIIRVVKSLANAEGNTKLLTRAIADSNRAWEEDNALTEEAGKRYDTYESKVTLLNNAVNNLAIAFGDTLRPLAGQLAETGADILNGIAGFLEKAPGVTAAIVGIGAGLGTLVLNLVKVTPLVKEMKDNIAALGGLGNVFTPTSLAIAGVVAAITILVTAVSKYNEKINEATKESRTFKKTTEDTIKAINEQEDAVKSEADNIVGLSKVLAELMEAEEKSAGQKAVLLDTIKQLNEAVPSLSLAYDEESDSLYKITTGEKIYLDTIQALARVEAERIVQQQKIEALTQLYVRQTQAEEKYAEVSERVNASKAEWNRLHGYFDVEKWIHDNRALSDEWSNYGKALEAVNAEIEEYNGLLISSTEAQDENAKSIDELKARIQILEQQWNTNKEAAEENFRKTVEGFDKVAKASTTSYKTIIENLKSQMDWLTKYDDNRQNILDRDIEGIAEFVASFDDGTQEAAGYMASFAQMSDEEIQKVIELWQSVNNKVGEVSANYADYMDDNIAKTEEMRNELNRLTNTHYSVGTPSSNNHPYITANAQGLDYVPFDDYLALLHEGEMVLTKAEARAYRLSHMGNNTVNNRNETTNFGGVTLNLYAQRGQDINDIADKVIERLDVDVMRKQAVWK